MAANGGEKQGMGGKGQAEGRGGACSSMFYGIRGNLRGGEERIMRNQRQEEVLDFVPTSEPLAGEIV